MQEYENRLGKVYRFRAKKTKLGKVTYVASTKLSPDDIERIPRGYEIYENADYRMCYRGEGGWMYLGSGTLEILAKKTMPHLELESFYELM